MKCRSHNKIHSCCHQAGHSHSSPYKMISRKQFVSRSHLCRDSGWTPFKTNSSGCLSLEAAHCHRNTAYDKQQSGNIKTRGTLQFLSSAWENLTKKKAVTQCKSIRTQMEKWIYVSVEPDFQKQAVSSDLVVVKCPYLATACLNVWWTGFFQNHLFFFVVVDWKRGELLAKWVWFCFTLVFI